ncbi:MAG TPA: LPS export ABC transporter ATP-binding protein [Thermodesulfatator sp.]|nr:LPS export ABC transporter ATP-binding protein [Thermodesulfatator sp.]
MQADHLQAQGLVKEYHRRRVVDGVDLSVSRGEIVGLLGPNGAGKTTTFYMVAGLIRPDSGRVFLDEEEITHLPMHRRARLGITYLPQEASIFRKLTVMENVLAILERRGLSRRECRRRAEQLVAEFGLEHVATQKGYQLSGGERRRVEIMRALATDPSFVLLDEPFAGIDPLAVADLQGLIRELKERDLGVIISDHNVRETLTVCDRAYIVSQGKIIEEGTPYEIARSERARKFYLGEGFSL